MLSFGVTTVEGKSGYGLDRETEIKQLEVMKVLDATHPIDIARTFLGAHAVPKEYRGDPDRYVDYLIRDVLPEIGRLNLAQFCDVFCEKGVFDLAQSRRLLDAARSFGLAPKLHADELTPLGGAELAAELGAVSADHLLYASEEGIARMAARDVVAVLLPATAFTLKEPYAPARSMIDRGCAVALATDFNPGSCFSESIPLIFALATLYMGMTPEEAVTACTLNGAAALGRAETIGSLDAGKQGDLIILEFPSYLFIPYHVGVNCVEKVVKRGKVVYDSETEPRRGSESCL
jgi:imidazolonepropionase